MVRSKECYVWLQFDKPIYQSDQSTLSIVLIANAAEIQMVTLLCIQLRLMVTLKPISFCDGVDWHSHLTFFERYTSGNSTDYSDGWPDWKAMTGSTF